MAQLRVLAATELGSLPRDYKTERCTAYDDGRSCTRGAQPSPSAQQGCQAPLHVSIVAVWVHSACTRCGSGVRTAAGWR